MLLLDNEWFVVPGAKGFAHLGVGGVGTVRSVGITLFLVRKTVRTWNRYCLIMNDLLFQVRKDSLTWESAGSVQG